MPKLRRLSSLSFIIILLSPAISVAASFISTGDGGWEWQYPTPQGQTLYSTSFVSETTGWAVGGSGVVLKTTNSGVAWSPQLSGTIGSLKCVQFLDANTGWAAGDTGIYTTTDGGGSWSSQDTRAINGLYFTNSSTGWSVGNLGTILKTTDSGTTWSAQTSGTTNNLTALFFINSSTGWAVGDGGTILTTADGGDTWNPQTSGTTGNLRCVQFLDTDTGWAAGDSGIFKTVDGGAVWTSQDANNAYTSLHFIDSSCGWALSLTGSVYSTINGGQNWTLQYSAIGTQLYSLCFLNTTSAVAVGKNGLIVKTNDSGSTWNPTSQVADYALWAADFVDTTTGFAVGKNWIYKTADGGATWNVQATPNKCSLFGVDFISSSMGWAVGKRTDGKSAIYSTTDGGGTWATNNQGFTANLRSVYFIDSTTGWAVGYGETVLKTNDGGATWVQKRSIAGSELNCVYFADATNGWAVGGTMGFGLILKTTDGGETWTSYSGSPINSRLWSVCFVNATTGWACGENGTILKTTDGGDSWVAKTSGTIAMLLSVSFVDTQTGWAVGNTVLKTTNGGETWNPQNAGGTYSLHCVRLLGQDDGWAVGSDSSYGSAILHTSTSGIPGCVWAKQQIDGKSANFGHVVAVEKSPGYVYVQHPDGFSGIRVNTTDTSVNVGDFIYIHGAVGTTNKERVINAAAIDSVTPQSGTLPNRTDCVSAKQQPNGGKLTLGELVVTAVFPSYIYAESVNRVVGIRINTNGSGIKIGDMIGVRGSMGSVDGERMVNASAIGIVLPEWGAIAPLGMHCKFIGGGNLGTAPDFQPGVTGGNGLNTIGLLVRTWGYLNASTMTLVDDSRYPIKLILESGITINPAWTHVTVNGVCSRDAEGNRVIHVTQIISNLGN